MVGGVQGMGMYVAGGRARQGACVAHTTRYGQ